MWLMSTKGFYSAVEKPEDREAGTVTIRARNKRDIDALVKTYLPDAKPWRLRRSDYEWRVRVPKQDWALAMAQMALDIDYSNYKDEVKRRQGKRRASIYGRVWGVLLDLETKGRWAKTVTTQTADDGDGFEQPPLSTWLDGAA